METGREKNDHSKVVFVFVEIVAEIDQVKLREVFTSFMNCPKFVCRFYSEFFVPPAVTI